MERSEEIILLGPFTQLLSMDSMPLKGAISNEQLNPIIRGGIVLQAEHILKCGDYDTLYSEAVASKWRILKLEGEHVVLPGYIDAHTHICFAGSRARDFSMRNSGKSYLDIAAAGGGIKDTVMHTRQCCQHELSRLTQERASSLLAQGITTIEVKSGYGLTVADELKMLRAIKAANENVDAELISTCLAAHTVPREYNGSSEDYLKEMADELFPILHQEQLCSRVDIFIEKTAFSVIEGQEYISRAKPFNFDITVHADQFTTGGSALAVSIGAVSADHLEASTDVEVALLANSNTIAIALPGASIGLGCAFTPARKLLDAGASLAIASDWNPGSAPMGNLLCQASILACYEKLSDAEVFAAITYRAAASLKLSDRGRLAKGQQADFVIYNTDDYREILYAQGRLQPSEVWKRGKKVITTPKVYDL